MLSIISCVIVNSTIQSLESKAGLPFVNQLAAWAIFLFSIILPFVRGVKSKMPFFDKLLFIYLCYAPVMILLSISFEVAFYALFSLTLFLWLLIERDLYSLTEISSDEDVAIDGFYRKLKISDTGRALFFISFFYSQSFLSLHLFCELCLFCNR